MEHDFIIITSTNEIIEKDNFTKYPLRGFSHIVKEINSWDLKSQRFLMAESDYQDILKWAEENK